jgi:hypothetical protein
MNNCDFCGREIDDYEARVGAEFHEDDEPICTKCIAEEMMNELGAR